MPVFSSGHQSKLRPGGFPQANMGGSFAGKVEAEVIVAIGIVQIGAHGILAGRGNNIGKGI